MNKYPYLEDSSFLKSFDRIKLRDQYVKINILTLNEKFIQEIQGKVIDGNINIDGSSSIRRTANLTVLADEYANDLTNVENLFSLNKKVELEIGFKNITDKYQEYPIIWFPQGYYVICNASISRSLNGATISLQLKDKMCLLNGECGGTFPASVIFHELDTFDNNGKVVKINPTIYQIIVELVNHWGGEQLGKIIISDVDKKIKQVVKWQGATPIYISRLGNGQTGHNITTNKSEINESYTEYNFGDDIGYILTDFIYPGELIGDAGMNICDILDKIKNTLGNFEYFYDVEGNFIFQEIKNYINTSFATVEIERLRQNDYLVDFRRDKAVYNFDDNNLITSFNVTPQYNMIKNDFVVWGIRKTPTGGQVPIRYHLAIDSKPKIGNTYQVFFYEDPEDELLKAKKPVVVATFSDLPREGVINSFYYVEDKKTIYKYDAKTKSYKELPYELKNIITKDWRTELYLAGATAEKLATDGNYYYSELLNEWSKLYDVEKGDFKEEAKNNPNEIDFYLDFIDSTTNIGELSISNIGRRTKVINDDSINCLFEPEIPDIVMINLGDDLEYIEEIRNLCIKKGQNFSQVPSSIYKTIAIGGNLNSAYVMIRSLLYQYTRYNTTITLQTIPIYYLEPNTRINVRDTRSGIFGDFIINKISIPLNIRGTMNISCSQALERI